MPPILLLIYNRPEHTRLVLQRLRELGITELYVSADGPKDAADMVACRKAQDACRTTGMNLISNFRTTHLGCKNGVISGINWFFNHVESGIILEDDCIPNAAFLDFCSHMLEQYASNSSVYMVSGNNPLGTWESGHSHHFSRIGHIWGWATWRDRLENFDPNLPNLESFSENNGFTRLFGNTDIPKELVRNVKSALNGTIDTWDFLWTTHQAILGRLAIIPSENLIENIGFDSSATHTSFRPLWISTHVRNELLVYSNPSCQPDRAYEMSLFSSKKRNKIGSNSPNFFLAKGRVCNQKLRVLQINSTESGGGAESIVLQNHRMLLSKGHFAKFLVGSSSSTEEGLELLQSDAIKQINTFCPDVIHIHNLHETALSLESLCELSKEIPVVWTLHDSWLTTGSEFHPFDLEGQNLSYLDLERYQFVLERRKSVISATSIRFLAPSQWMRNRMLKIYGLETHFVANAIAIPSKKPKDDTKGSYLLFVANHADRNPYKDLDTLISAWKIVVKILNIKQLNLICIGGKKEGYSFRGSTFQMLERQSSSVVKEYLSEALFLVQASLQDNSPLSIMESHSVGTPVIASMVGGIPELLGSLESELMYETQNPTDLANNLISALQRVKELREEVTSNSRNLIDTAEMNNTYLGHYLDVIHG